MKDWERRYQDELRERRNYRGRRYQACNAAQVLHDIVEQLGVEDDPSMLPIPGQPLQPVPSAAQKRELQNLVALTLRMILLHNDGGCSPQTLPRY